MLRRSCGLAATGDIVQKNQGSAFPHVLEWIVLGLVFVYLAFFVFAWNSGQTITLRYWANAPLQDSRAAFPILASFLVGFAVATLVASLVSLDRLIELRRVRKRLRALQEEISRMRMGGEARPPITSPGSSLTARDPALRRDE
jgi:uncharacterized integral membrane protein